MREKVIAGNWKMNTTPSVGLGLATQVAEFVLKVEGVTVVICPPATHLQYIRQSLEAKASQGGNRVYLGAQNVHWADAGAYTGELSVNMLERTGCSWVIIGHSERRQYFGETDKSVNKRLLRVQNSKLRPMVCIGESLEERENGKTFEVLERQLDVGLKDAQLGGDGGLVIAYEPVWAIGTGLTATPDQAQEAHHFIRTHLAEMFDKDSADATVIQYGGSMNEKNAAELLACEDIDGGLIGGASLDAKKFAGIVLAAAG